jgi:hypothetical protein
MRKTLVILNRTQTKGLIHTRTLCQKNQGTLKIKQKPVTVGGRTTYRTLSHKRTSFQTENDGPICERCLETDESATHTHPMRVWGHGLLKIPSPGPLSHGTRRLSWRPCKQNPALHSKCGTVEALK